MKIQPQKDGMDGFFATVLKRVWLFTDFNSWLDMDLKPRYFVWSSFMEMENVKATLIELCERLIV